MTLDVTKPTDDVMVSELPEYIRETREEIGIASTDYATILAEISTARGSRDTLDQRLDTALNPDGTLKAEIEVNISEWVGLVEDFVYSDSTTFTVTGDQTDIFVAKRRVQINMTASTAYSEVVSPTYNAGPDTTTVVVLDAVVGATLESVDYGLIAPIGSDSSLSMNMLDQSSTAQRGVVELATSAETITGTDTERAITPAGLQTKVTSATVKGIVELATNAETITGTDDTRAVTPAGLAAKVTSATVSGIVELATDAETITGTDTGRAVTPASLQAKVTSATVKGIVELATDAETITGTDTERAVTPASLQAKVSSETVKGIVELATVAESVTGTDTGRVVTPAGVKGVFDSPPTIGGTAPSAGVRTKLEMTAHAANETASASSMYGGVHRITGAYTVTLPTAVIGMSALFMSTTAVAYSIKAGGSDHLILNGAILDAGDKVTSGAGLGDTIYIFCDAANTWQANLMNALFTDGGA